MCVVGGGIAGCSAALHLAERGLKVTLLEDNRIGWGASGRSGAQAIQGVAAGQAKLDRLIGPAAARAVWDVSIEGLTLMRQLIRRFSIDCNWVDGYMLAAVKERHVRELRAELTELRDDYDYAQPALHGARGAARDARDRALPWRALRQQQRPPAPAQLHPGTRRGGRNPGSADLRRHAGRCPSPPRRTRKCASATAAGEVRARHLVLCGNVYLGATAPALARKIMAVATYIVATEPLGEARARALISNNAAVSDMNWVLDYYRRSADHRLLFGGRVNYSGLKSFDAPSATRARMLNVFPQLKDVRIEYAWGGEVDITLNRAPHFGRLAPNVYFLQGFSGHGIALTGIAGKLVAEAIGGTAGALRCVRAHPAREFPGWHGAASPGPGAGDALLSAQGSALARPVTGPDSPCTSISPTASSFSRCGSPGSGTG